MVNGATGRVVAWLHERSSRENPSITDRQRDVIVLIAAGYSNDEIRSGSAFLPGRSRRIATYSARNSESVAGANYQSRTGA